MGVNPFESLFPHHHSHDGTSRKFGFEIEFSDLSLEDTSEVCAAVLSGIAKKETDYRYVVTSRWGEFGVERDLEFLQQIGEERARGEEPGTLKKIAETVAAPIAASFLPTEVVAPPLPLNDLLILDDLGRALAEAGAKGTRDGLLYAFGLQINAEAWSTNPRDILSVLRAYSLLHPLLLEWLDIDRLRRLSGFIEPYPAGYVDLVLQKSYQPDLATLIDDYLKFNPTRDRALDLLCLFSELDPDRVFSQIDKKGIKPRPAYHYRLPNSEIGDPGWNVTDPLRSWALIETLAADPSLLEASWVEELHASA